eukprot:gene23587-biopygen5832
MARRPNDAVRRTQGAWKAMRVELDAGFRVLGSETRSLEHAADGSMPQMGACRRWEHAADGSMPQMGACRR